MRRRARAAVLGLTVLVAACSSGNASGAGGTHPGSTARPGPSTSPVPTPLGLAAPGTLTVAADPTEAPLVYYDRSNRFAGFSIELLTQVATQMGLELDVINIDGGQVAPGLVDQQHRYDIGIAPKPAPGLGPGFSTLEYLVGGQAILAPRDDRVTTGMQSLCGRHVGAKRDSSAQASILRNNADGCHDNPTAYTAYDDDVKGVHDLRAGSLQAYVQDYAVATAVARLYSDVRVVPHRFAPAPEVLVFAATDPALHDAVSSAFERVRHNGDYRRLLDRWGLQEGAVS